MSESITSTLALFSPSSSLLPLDPPASTRTARGSGGWTTRLASCDLAKDEASTLHFNLSTRAYTK